MIPEESLEKIKPLSDIKKRKMLIKKKARPKKLNWRRKKMRKQKK